MVPALFPYNIQQHQTASNSIKQQQHAAPIIASARLMQTRQIPRLREDEVFLIFV